MTEKNKSIDNISLENLEGELDTLFGEFRDLTEAGQSSEVEQKINRIFEFLKEEGIFSETLAKSYTQLFIDHCREGEQVVRSGSGNHYESEQQWEAALQRVTASLKKNIQHMIEMEHEDSSALEKFNAELEKTTQKTVEIFETFISRVPGEVPQKAVLEIES